MIKNYCTKQIKINANIAGQKPGDVIKIKVDQTGVPIDRYWRDRFKDAEFDNCVELVADQSSPKKGKKQKASDSETSET